jgi:hypothetical protein
MEHYYNKLEHWFDYEDVFLEAIQKSKDGISRVFTIREYE